MKYWDEQPAVLKKVIWHALKTVPYGDEIKTIEELERQIDLINLKAPTVLSIYRNEKLRPGMTFPRTIAECLSLSEDNKSWLHRVSERKWITDHLEQQIANAPILALFKVLPWIQSTQDLGLHRYINDLGVAVELGNKSRVASLANAHTHGKNLREVEHELAALKKKLKQYEEIVKFRNDEDAMKTWKNEEAATRNGWNSGVVNPYLTGV